MVLAALLTEKKLRKAREEGLEQGLEQGRKEVRALLGSMEPAQIGSQGPGRGLHRAAAD